MNSFVEWGGWMRGLSGLWEGRWGGGCGIEVGEDGVGFETGRGKSMYSASKTWEKRNSSVCVRLFVFGLEGRDGEDHRSEIFCSFGYQMCRPP